MATAKKRKVNSEGRHFQEWWKVKSFFTERRISFICYSLFSYDARNIKHNFTLSNLALIQKFMLEIKGWCPLRWSLVALGLTELFEYARMDGGQYTIRHF